MDYGFEIKSERCGGKTCFNKDKIRDIDDMFNKANKLTDKRKDSSITAYRRASCHPYMKENVVPKVEYFWTLFPCNLLYIPFGIPIILCEALSMPCCWFCYL